MTSRSPARPHVILRVVWIGAAAGVFTQLAWPNARRLVVVSLYLVVGWSALMVIDDIRRALGVAGFVLVLAGGRLHPWPPSSTR